jgi:hypothetical protein
VICCPVTTVRLTAAGVPRIIATERTYQLVGRSMVALLVSSQLVLSSDAAPVTEAVVNKILFFQLLPPSLSVSVTKLNLRKALVLRTCFDT